jgi:hypothetical protein
MKHWFRAPFSIGGALGDGEEPTRAGVRAGGGDAEVRASDPLPHSR